MSPKNSRLSLAQKAAITRELINNATWRCQKCRVRHGTMIELPSGAYFRYELGLRHLNGKPWDFRRKNLAVWCQVCRQKDRRPRRTVVFRPESANPRQPIGA